MSICTVKITKYDFADAARGVPEPTGEGAVGHRAPRRAPPRAEAVTGRLTRQVSEKYWMGILIVFFKCSIFGES